MTSPTRQIFALAFCLLLVPACAAEPVVQEAEAAAAPEDASAGAPTSEDERTIYAIGLAMSQSLGNFGLTDEELGLVIRGLEDGYHGRDTGVSLQEYGPKLQAFAQARVASQAVAEKAAGQAYAAEQAAAEGAVQTDSGLVYSEIAAGAGAGPAAADKVRVHYTGTLRGGEVFDSSVERGEPAEFALNQVIPCWTEGLQRMKVGGKSRLVCPPEIAYGDQPRPKIPAGSTLVFEVELLEIVAAP